MAALNLTWFKAHSALRARTTNHAVFGPSELRGATNHGNAHIFGQFLSKPVAFNKQGFSSEPCDLM